MGIQLSKLVSDNLAKGKQPLQNSLLNFVARSKTLPITEDAALKVSSSPHVPEKEPTAQVNEEAKEVSIFELPSVSQIDSTVFNELPDYLKNDIIKDYQRKGITIDGISSTQTQELIVEPSSENVAGPSHQSHPIDVGTSRSENPVSYDGIDQITDIDASYWSALPDDIKAEIERDIQQRKAETTSPVKGWKNIFKPQQRSPAKTTSKPVKRKTKAQDTIKTKAQPTVRAPVLSDKVFLKWFIHSVKIR